MNINTTRGGGKGPTKVGNHNRRKQSDTVLMGIEIHSLSLHPKPARVQYPLVRRAHRVPTREGTAIIRQSSSCRSFERIDTPRGDGVARQSTLVCDS